MFGFIIVTQLDLTLEASKLYCFVIGNWMCSIENTISTLDDKRKYANEKKKKTFIVLERRGDLIEQDLVDQYSYLRRSIFFVE